MNGGKRREEDGTNGELVKREKRRDHGIGEKKEWELKEETGENRRGDEKGEIVGDFLDFLVPRVLVLLILTLKRHRKGKRMSEDEEDMRDNVIKYNDEGGGEQDTQAYDMSALRSLYDFPEVKNSDSVPDLPSIPQWIQNRVVGDGGAADFSVFKGYIRKKVEQADGDISVPPYDSFQTYAFEGNASPALSLSSIRTLSTTSEQDFSYLSDWGPRFRQLAGYYAPVAPAEEEAS
ncbi:hypothetical protein DNTS_016345 [Danionella cerebrum]|uniref:Cadherin Y-type LIR-motif domain-containing protein n=1 Tax=Danionella cerebrum TaxID=2873325 RepID=A0A553MZC4_9TELE|nr:hypothetical protein DNTS_016345 [Danionella translucida]TRY58534.1 hypothetical protein DNTS_016345 [Danionella translucida]